MISHGRPEDELFLLIRSIESDTERFPIRAAREGYDATYLQHLDDELQSYLTDVGEELVLFCKEISSHPGPV